MRASRMISLCLWLSACAKPTTGAPPVQSPVANTSAHVNAKAAAEAAHGPESPPHGRLPTDTTPISYRLQLEIDPDRADYAGSVDIEVELTRPRDTIWMHSNGPRAREVQLTRDTGDPLTGTLEAIGEGGLAALRLSQPVGPGRVRIQIHFDNDFGTRLSGLYKVQNAGQNYVFSQFEAISAREAFPCFDEPRFKTPFEVSLRVKSQHVAITNTQPRDERPLASDMREIHFAPTQKLPTYLIAFAVGPLDVVNAEGIAPSSLRARELPLRGVAPHGRGADLTFALADAHPLVHWLEQYFDYAYPYDKLDLIAVPDFGFGAMENAGAITYRDTLLLVGPEAPEEQRYGLSYISAHELAHHWFGDLVTMPWWDDVWLNESFATWMGMRTVGAVHPDFEFGLRGLEAIHNAMLLDGSASARKIRQPIETDDDIVNAFDGITYAKGGAVLGMFERYLGPDTFQAGIRAHMKRYAFGSASAPQLVRSLVDAAHNPEIEPAFFSFLDQAGVPQVRMQLDCSSQPPALELTQTRYRPLGTDAPMHGQWHIPLCVRTGPDHGDGRTPEGAASQPCFLLREPSARVTLDVPGCPKWVMPNADAAGYYRWALDDAALAALLQARAALSTPEQMSLMSNVMAALRAGQVSPERTVDSLRELAQGSQRQVLGSVLEGYRFLFELLSDAERPALRDEVARALTPGYRKLGLIPKTRAESGDEKLRRLTMVEGLATLARDAQVLEALAVHGAKLLAGQPSTLPHELVTLAITAAIGRDGQPLFDKALQQVVESSDGLVRSQRLEALSAVQAPDLGARALALALDPRLRTNERIVPLHQQMRRPETRERALEWLRGHFDELASLLDAAHRDVIVTVARDFCSAKAANELSEFFGPRMQQVPGGPRSLALTLERVKNCVAVEKQSGAALRALFAAPKR